MYRIIKEIVNISFDFPFWIIVHKVCAWVSQLMINVINQGDQHHRQKNVTIESYRDISSIAVCYD